MRTLLLFLVAAMTMVLMLTGFSLDSSIVPKDEILSGGPPKDGIPALLEPAFVAAGKQSFLDPEDQVLGVVADGVVKAYPIKILTWHEAVNDSINEQSFVVTY
ncbi:MAG: DUF3179 domain-containing protein [Desulfobacteraceae bacterium]|nr:DUF3179 domain-containing protein [Desulfobacteraceae bacterium]